VVDQVGDVIGARPFSVLEEALGDGGKGDRVHVVDLPDVTLPYMTVEVDDEVLDHLGDRRRQPRPALQVWPATIIDQQSTFQERTL
jgi:hypothetical protein